MPKYTNYFASPEYTEQKVMDGNNGGALGTIRIKPSSVLWKPKNSRHCYSIPLQKFTDWITDKATKATKTKS